MANWGTTTITVTGPQADRAALCAALDETACGILAFSLARMAPDIWCGDSLVRVAEMTQADDALRLHVCRVHDGDCPELAPSLSERYSALRFETWFDCESTWPNFTIAIHEGGAEHCHALFQTTHLASLTIDPASPRHRSAVPFYQRTPERDLAADAALGDVLDVFLRRPEAVAGWRRSDDEATSLIYLMPNADKAGHLVLALDMIEASATLLRDVDRHGGYLSSETLSLDQARDRMPELAAEIDRLMRETAADRQQHQSCQDEEIPF